MGFGRDVRRSLFHQIGRHVQRLHGAEHAIGVVEPVRGQVQRGVRRDLAAGVVDARCCEVEPVGKNAL